MSTKLHCPHVVTFLAQLALFCQLGVKYARYVSEVEKIMKDKKQYRGWAQICSSLVSESKNRTKNKVKNLFTCNSV